jgi:hypothetical protein
MLRVAPARIAAISLALFACLVQAQQPATGILTVVVEDQTRARIAGARITAIEEATGSRFGAICDASGQAVVHLNQGRYEMTVQAAGFKGWKESHIEVKTGTKRTVTLAIGAYSSGPVVYVGAAILFEYPTLEVEIPMIPMQQFDPPAKPFRHRWHWF